MCVVLAAFDFLSANPKLGVQIHLTGWQVFAWLVVSGLMGVLMAVPMRRHFIEEEQLTFADGVATAETLTILDSGGASAKRRTRALSLGALSAMTVTWFRDGWPRLVRGLRARHVIEDGTARVLELFSIPENSYLGALGVRLHAQTLHLGVNWSLLSIGSGMLVGLRVALSMALGMLLSWVIAPPLLHDRGIVTDFTYSLTLRWVMWPATGLMIAGGLTALALRWRLLVKTFSSLSSSSLGAHDFPIRWVTVGLAVLSVCLAVVQKSRSGFPSGRPRWPSCSQCRSCWCRCACSARPTGDRSR